MNQLSWLLYWGNVAGNLGGFLVFFGIVCLVGLIFRLILYYATFSDVNRDLRYCYDENQVKQAKLIKYLRFPGFSVSVIAFMMLFCWAAAAFCPSSTTVYAIAASQIGEKALQTPLAGKAGEALTAWLNHQITEVAPTQPTSNKSD